MLDLQKIKRNTNDFSFIETVASLANNKEYKSGYLDLINEKTNDKTYFWTALSAVGEEVGSVIYENVLNYINNVSNINTCKLRALTSIAKVLGVMEFAILKNLKTIPEDVLKFMDVFSINRAYLLNINTFDSDFVKDLLSSTLNEETLLSAEEMLEELAVNKESEKENLSSVFSVFAAISNEKYNDYVEEVFFRLLSTKLFQTYGDVLSDFIYSNLSCEGTLSSLNDLTYTRSTNSDFKSDEVYNKYWTFEQGKNNYKSDYPQLVYRYKKALNVPPGFNESEIVDNIETGNDFLDNYQGGELSVLLLEINERSKTKFTSKGGYEANRLNTRYSYYNEQEVRQYVKFIDDIYVLKQSEAAAAISIEDISSSFLNWNPYFLSNGVSPYDIDPNYSDVSISSNTSLMDNINLQFNICKNEVSSFFPKNTFAEFVYKYYGNVFSDEVKENDKLSILSKGNLLRIVARILKDICLAIVDIREKLKTQAQRNYMTGTKLLIEYILNEYLVNTLINTYDTDPETTRAQENGEVGDGLMHQSVGAQIIEYIDTTEYFNIGLLSDETGYAKSGVNLPYYSDLSGGGFTGYITGRGLEANAIRNFYLSSLNISSNYISDDNTFYDFMSAVYEVGITKTYVGSDGALNIDKTPLAEDLSINLDLLKISSAYNLTEEDYDFLKKNWCVETSEGYKSINYDIISDYIGTVSNDLSVISSDFEKYNEALSVKIAQQTELMLKYHGSDIAYYPWYNYKNRDFATFQAHPYLYNFVEHENDKYPIENAFYGNANEDLIYELQTENISVYLGELGNINRIWRNSGFDYSGYKSRYENSLHVYGSSNSNGLYSVTHYDGIFYPPAIDLYKKYVNGTLFERIERDGETYVLSGFELLSTHMIDYVDGRKYDSETNLTIPEISSLWHYYSHLNLTRAERLHITNQLIALSADIMDMSDAEYRRNNNNTDFYNVEEPYDVYKYGLDYNKNSIILLKRYADGRSIISNKTATQAQKKNTLGQLWIKLNSHPIGFPAFLNGEKKKYSNVLLDTSKEDAELNRIIVNGVYYWPTTKFGSGTSINNIYDFDIAGNGRYLVFAIENPSENVEDKTYKTGVSIASRILQRKHTNYASPEDEIRQYMLVKSGPTVLYPTNDGQGTFDSFDLTKLKKSDYEFDGFFQGDSTLYAIYFKRSGNEDVLSSIYFNAIAYPSQEQQSLNSESKSFCFERSYKVDMLNTIFAKTEMDAKVKFGYFSESNSFTIAVANEVLSDKQLYIQDFVGFNSEENFALSDDTQLSNGHGFTEYIEATSGNWNNTEEKNIDSFDRFSHLISIYDIKESEIRRREPSPKPAIYALNSDASYIPLYYGVNGENLHYKLKDGDSNLISYNKWWHSNDEDLTSNYVPRNSMELLGYSYQDFAAFVEDKENTIYEDEETGHYTSVNASDLIENSLRIYENYVSANFVFEEYNKGFLWRKTDEDEREIEFTIDLSSLNSETSSMFNILLLNCHSGQDRNPIIAGQFSYDTINNIYYNSESTEEEDCILSTGFKPDNLIHIVGTPNPFNVKDQTFGLDYTNHIFNISGMRCMLEWDGEKFHLKVKLTRRDSSKDFAIQTEQLLLYVYKNTLEQFERYHYMEPFGLFPNNAAMSVWNLPWKDKSHAWLYMKEFDSLSDWWKDEYGDYLDKRVIDPENVSKDSYKDALSAYGVYISAIVGHLPISAYDSDTNELSIDADDSRLTTLSLMENITLSSLSSFNDNYYLSTGQITWKISEEDKFDYLKLMYPPTLIDTLLYDKFYGYNKEHVSYNIFELSNTYIFQLEDPLSIANKIGIIAVPIGSASDEFTMVYEDYLSDQISIDVGGINVLSYKEMLYDLSNEQLIIDPDETQSIISNELTAINERISSLMNIDDALSIAETSGYFEEASEKNGAGGVIDYFLLSATPEEISDYLKIYVNWRKYEQPGNDDEIELFFNYPNLFISPYSYRMANGMFSVEYKKNTYLNLKSGEDGYLYIIFQFKYYDSTGSLRGIRDLPILTYHIYNVSDDKPKFIITKTYEIDNRDGRYTYPGDGNKNKVFIIVNKNRYTHDTMIETSNGRQKLDDAIGYDYCLNSDLYLNTTVDVFSPIPLHYLDFEMAYDRGKMPDSKNDDDPEFVFEPLFSKPGTYTEYKGNISAHFDGNTYESKLEFTMLMNSKINEDTNQRYFPIEILNADAKDINGNTPEFVFINGLIEIDDNTDGIGTGAYLARELNFDNTPEKDLSAVIHNNEYNAGWVLEETRRALIRMYSIGTAGDRKILAELSGDEVLPLKTTGYRESRLDKQNNLFILEDTGDI